MYSSSLVTYSSLLLYQRMAHPSTTAEKRISAVEQAAKVWYDEEKTGDAA
jgi:hypothetical protein